jgi:hypothetical protein
MGDFLAELFEQFDQEEQTRIKEAEASAIEKITQGTAAVRDRRQASGSRDDGDWVLQPEHDAQIDAAGVVFVAYANALWQRTDATRAESTHDFLAKVKQLILPVLTRYGWEGEALMNEMHRQCASYLQRKVRTGAASTTSSTGDSSTDSPQETDNASGRVKVSDATEQPDTNTGQSIDTAGSTIRFEPREILTLPNSWRQHQRQNADVNATYARYKGRNGFGAARQEELLKDARAWAEATLTELASAARDVFELREQVVKETWDKFVPRHRHHSDLLLGYRDFSTALWEEGWPSLEDRAIRVFVASQTRKASSAGPQSPPGTRLPSVVGSSGSGPKRRDFLERLSGDDSNRHVAPILYKAWADSHRLVADGFAGDVSLSDYVEANMNTFAQCAEAHLAFKDTTSISGKCKELDRIAKSFIRTLSKSLAPHSERLGKEMVDAAIDELSRRISEIASRTKQKFFEQALATSAPPAKWVAGDLERVKMDHPDLPASAHDLIAAAELQAQTFLDGVQNECGSLRAQAHDLGVSPSDIDFAPGNLLLQQAGERLAQGRALAADHVFRITAVQYWNRMQSDVDCFMTEVEIRWRQVHQRFQLNGDMPEDSKRNWKAWALRGRATETRAVSKSPPDLPAKSRDGAEGVGMDLSDLPRTARTRLAEAEVEAKYIIREAESSALFSTLAPKSDGEDSESGPDESLDARNKAALHLFHATAAELWDRVRPDLDVFKARLTAARKWLDGKFNPDPGVMRKAANRELRSARRDLATKRIASEAPKTVRRGVLGEILARRRQALKEGRLEGYVESPSGAQTFPQLRPRGLSLPEHIDKGAAEIRQLLPTVVAVDKSGKGNLELLRGTDGQLKRAVTLEIARRFGGVTRRAIEKAARKGALESEGDGLNRRIIVQSLLSYYPPENSTN